MSDQNTEPDVRDVPERHSYIILVDGKQAGFTAYRDRGGQRVFYHTVIDDEFAGQGLASRLVAGALDDVRAQGKRIVPVCPYVKKYLGRHDGFGDITDPVTPEVREWLEGQLHG
jgi:predicted GNAT family acetyltransferase